MLSINTNLSSLISQSNMKQSTGKLNQAVERLSTGYKINHAKDNAANYSISTNMTTKLGAYQVAEENVSMGLDLVATANDIISQMQDRASRLHALSTQARNGTYGGQSLMAINQEAAALVDEIVRLYNTSEYNGVNLFNRTEYTIAEHLPKAGKSGFIDESAITTSVEAQEEYGGFIVNPVEYTKEQIANMVALTDDVDTITSGTEYSIKDVEQLINFAELVNSGVDTTGAIFVLADDIDLGAYCDANMATGGWKPIRNFKGTFNGNGHKISNLKAVNGLFTNLQEASVVKNLGIVDVEISGKGTIGALASSSTKSTISNCYSIGTISSTTTGSLGLLLGSSTESTIKMCYSKGRVEGVNHTGGLIGTTSRTEVEACFSSAEVVLNSANLSSPNLGGLIGHSMYSGKIINCYATGNVKDYTGLAWAGGLLGCSWAGAGLESCYATGNVSGVNDVGGLVGVMTAPITNCYATGDVSGTENVGGLVGRTSSSIQNSYCRGDVYGEKFVGGLIGQKGNHHLSVKNSISYSLVTGNEIVGSLVGGILSTSAKADGAFVNCLAIAQDLDYVSGYYKSVDSIYENSLVDVSTLNAKINAVDIYTLKTKLQIGINADASSEIVFDSNLMCSFKSLQQDISGDSFFDSIISFINLLDKKATELGSIENRLESVLDEIAIQYDNLVSSRSTIRDADMAEVSATYIQQQILQEAAATLMSTANQSPAIALQLI